MPNIITMGTMFDFSSYVEPPEIKEEDIESLEDYIDYKYKYNSYDCCSLCNINDEYGYYIEDNFYCSRCTKEKEISNYLEFIESRKEYR